VKASASDLLREAVREQHPNETFEKALGRIVRSHRGAFEDYGGLIERVRQRARRDKSSLATAANALADEGL
jgi:transcription antitermination factor NusG